MKYTTGLDTVAPIGLVVILSRTTFCAMSVSPLLVLVSVYIDEGNDRAEV